MAVHMKRYDDIVDEIYDEIMGAQQYAKKAVMFHTEDRTLSEMYHSMARQEYGHANTLIDAATRLSMTDETLRIMWERDHERMVKWMADVRSTLDMLRE